MADEKFLTKLLRSRTENLAQELSDIAREEGIRVAIATNHDHQNSRLELSGTNLVSNHFGKREHKPDSLIAHLLSSLTKRKRHSQ